MNYPRTEEGFARALQDVRRLIRWHDRSYSIFVSAKEPDRYGVAMAELMPPFGGIAPGTAIATYGPEDEKEMQRVDEETKRWYEKNHEEGPRP